jgi:hypothetical protein
MYECRWAVPGAGLFNSPTGLSIRLAIRIIAKGSLEHISLYLISSIIGLPGLQGGHVSAYYIRFPYVFVLAMYASSWTILCV